MSRVLFLVVLVGLPSLQLPWQPHLPAWAERWLYNPRERTERALEAYEQGHPEQGVAPAETALRIAGDDPLVGFNTGTVRLGAGNARRAAKVLEEAAKNAPPELAPAAHYNLGNARLAAKDAAGAVEAYKQTLRAEPGNADAKHNLEIALREREKERMRMKGQREGSRGDRKGEKDPSKQPGAENPSEQPDQRKSDANDPGQSQQKGQQGQNGEQQQPSQGSQGSDPRLPNFRNQPEMNAREAASLLQSVENLERRQRQQQAARRAQRAPFKEKDW